MIRWLLLGGGKAARAHARAIELSSDAQLAGVVTGTGRSTLKTPVFRGLDEALEGAAVDAVIIATPHHLHVDLSLASIARGLPVLCEKPVGRCSLDAVTIHNAAESAGVPVGVVLNQRACRHHRYVFDQIRSGALRAQRAAFSGTLGALRGWIGDRERSGGGALRIVGVHYLDLLRWWFGEATELSVSMSGSDVDEVVDFRARFGREVRGSLTLDMSGAGSPGPVTCDISGEGVSLSLRGSNIVATLGLPAPPPVESTRSCAHFRPGSCGGDRRGKRDADYAWHVSGHADAGSAQPETHRSRLRRGGSS